jgi:hypothetical protein
MTTIMFVVALVGSFTFKSFNGGQPEAAALYTADADTAMAPLDQAPGEIQEEIAEPAAESGPADEGDAARSQPIESMESMEEAESADGGGYPEQPEGLAPPTEISLSMEAEEATPEDPIAEGTLAALPMEDSAVEKAPEMDTFEPETAAEPAGADQTLPDDTGRINPWSIFTVLTGAAALFSGALLLVFRRR